MLLAYTRNRFSTIPLRLCFKFKPVWSSGPNTYCSPGKDTVSKDCFGNQRRLSIWHTLPVDATALVTLWSPELIYSITSLWFKDRIWYATDGWDNPIPPDRSSGLGFGAFIERLIAPAQVIWFPYMRTRPESGRFGVKLEGAGKIRVFAIANPILQALIRPIHDWAMSILRLLPTDGTYNQTAPLSRLRGKMHFLSFDLKAATDSLPVRLSGSLLAGLFGNEFAQSWVDILTQTAFRVPEAQTFKRQKAHVYRFTKGQPLGFYSSRPVFALTHHALVWLAAWRAHPGKLFLDYAILGDDLVIADEKVAAEYLAIMRDAEVTISKEKSLISRTGALEFAKRFMT
ncbi:hypothetical protein H6P81_021193 [Aristolochia fimbriata]|uniref:RNA-dependent RNA polymerase n=1 Tax=Aristolochia fimbriata TaxID=158543 RepID=A0AAV7DS64_ARIFI|nr:hypothetical protein H6P81_021193 [Aristolochia fimbriata]